MGYLLPFAFCYLGYTIIVKSWYTWQHKDANLWYLLTGQGQKWNSPSQDQLGGFQPNVNVPKYKNPNDTQKPPPGVPTLPNPQPSFPGP